MACEYCEQTEGHLALCPVTSILADANRAAAHPQVGVATSDWIDSAVRQLDVEEPLRDDETPEAWAVRRHERDRQILTDSFALHHQWVERVTAAPLKAQIATLNEALNLV